MNKENILTAEAAINPQEVQYLNLLHETHTQGQVKTDRTGTGTRSVFGRMMRFNLQEGLPILTTKKIHLKSVIHELIWFLSGDTNVKYLQDNGVTIWNEWVKEDGTIGPGYSKQWRSWEDTKILHPINDAAKIDKLQQQGYVYMGDTTYRGFSGKMVVLQKEYDQITEALNLIKHNPDSRRIIVSGWNVGDLHDMVLPPCHTFFQFYVSDLTEEERLSKVVFDGEGSELLTQEQKIALANIKGVPKKKLSCMLYCRSQDLFLGTPFNIASYAILVHMFAQQADMAVGDFIWVGGDCHEYSNHTEQVELQLSREVRPMPQLVIKRKPESLFDYKFEDFEVVNYHPHEKIVAPVAV